MSSEDSRPEDQRDPEAIAEKILKESVGILDRRQRTYAIGQKLKRYPAETILEIFRVIAGRARFKEPLYLDGYRTISDVSRLAKHVGFGKMSEVYTLARRKSYSEVISFMQMVPPAKRIGLDEELDEDPMLKEMTLGLKRQKARQRNRDMIDRLCNEQDPVVIQHLLKNPSVTLQHVIKIASKRPTSAKVLWVVYRDLKWVNHYVVKKTLISNPYTPTQVALSLLHFMLEQDLEEVAESMILHPRVRETAVDLIMLKRKETKNSGKNESAGD